MGMEMFTFGFPGAAEEFTRGDLLGLDAATNLVRLIQAGDAFQGYVLESVDQTGQPVGVYTHAQKTGLVKVANGSLEIKPAVGVTPILGLSCYAASPTTFSHEPVGTFIGLLKKPWDKRPGYWIIDTIPAYIQNVGFGDPRRLIVDMLILAPDSAAVTQYDVVEWSFPTNRDNVTLGASNNSNRFAGIASHAANPGTSLAVVRGGQYPAKTTGLDLSVGRILLSYENNAVRFLDAVDFCNVGRNIATGVSGNVLLCQFYFPPNIRWF